MVAVDLRVFTVPVREYTSFPCFDNVPLVAYSDTEYVVEAVDWRDARRRIEAHPLHLPNRNEAMNSGEEVFGMPFKLIFGGVIKEQDYFRLDIDEVGRPARR